MQKIVDSRGQKTFTKIVKQHLHNHMLFGRVSKKIITTWTSNGTGLYGQKKKKKKKAF